VSGISYALLSPTPVDPFQLAENGGVYRFRPNTPVTAAVRAVTLKTLPSESDLWSEHTQYRSS